MSKKVVENHEVTKCTQSQHPSISDTAPHLGVWLTEEAQAPGEKKPPRHGRTLYSPRKKRGFKPKTLLLCDLARNVKIVMSEFFFLNV